VILVENCDFSYHIAFNVPIKGVPFGVLLTILHGKTRMCGYPMVKKVRGYIELFRQNTGVWQTDIL